MTNDELKITQAQIKALMEQTKAINSRNMLYSLLCGVAYTLSIIAMMLILFN